MANASSKITTPAVDTAPGTEIVLADGTTVVVREADPNEVAEFLSGGMIAEQTEESAEEITRRMVTQVFIAETAKEIFSSGQAGHVRDYLDVPFTLLDVSWQKTAITDKDGNPQGMPVFAVIKAANPNGEVQTLTTSAFMPCAMMYRAQTMGVLSDVRVKFTKRDRPTRNGFFPINLELAD